MRDDDRRSRPATRVRTVTMLAIVAVLVALFPLSGHAAATTTWTRNLFISKAFVYQDPYYTACTAASVMHMLNTIAYRGSGGYGFRWTQYTVKKSSNPDQLRDMTSIQAFERRYDTLRSTSAGSDAHGWRNALNYYGWGSNAMRDASIRPYEDRAYSTYRSAMKAAVRAIARIGMPVGVLAWAGGHAQVITGYVVTGADPRVSTDFTIQWLYLSDPLKSDGIVNRKTSYGAMKDGALKYRFQWYRETDSPYDDPFTSGWIRSSVSSSVGPSEWFHKWVLILPVRRGLPPPPPPPDPEPTPTPTPTSQPTPELAPEIAPGPSANGSPSTGAEASPGATATAEPSPTPSPSAGVVPSPSSAATPTPAATATPTPSVPPTQSPAPTPTRAPAPTAPPSPSASASAAAATSAP